MTVPLARILARPFVPRMLLKVPTLRMNFQLACQIADRIWQAHPGDFASLSQVNLGVDRDLAFRAVDALAATDIESPMA